MNVQQFLKERVEEIKRQTEVKNPVRSDEYESICKKLGILAAYKQAEKNEDYEVMLYFIYLRRRVNPKSIMREEENKALNGLERSFHLTNRYEKSKGIILEVVVSLIYQFGKKNSNGKYRMQASYLEHFINKDALIKSLKHGLKTKTLLMDVESDELEEKYLPGLFVTVAAESVFRPADLSI